MTAYPDTSFLCAMYRMQSNSQQAADYFAAMQDPLYIASPMLFEFRQSIRWQSYMHTKDASKGFGRVTGMAALAKLQNNIATGAVLVVPVDWSDIVSIAERLSAGYTWTQGHRALDIIHVATGLHLGVTDFLTFDSNQKLLAEAEGLIVPI